MAMLPPEVLDLVFNLGYTFGRSEVCVKRQLRRRRFLRTAALVSRRWTGPANAALQACIVARRLGDFAAVEQAAQAGVLRLERVRTLVLDETDCGVLDGELRAWEVFEMATGAPVDRTASAMMAEMHSYCEACGCEAEVLFAFSRAAHQLVPRLPNLRSVRTAGSDTIARVTEHWPSSRLVIESISEESTLWTYGDELWTALGRWRALTVLSVVCCHDPEGALSVIRSELCLQLEALRLGVGDGRKNEFGVRQRGVSLSEHLFAGPTRKLRSLDVRLSHPHRYWDDDDAGRRQWPTLLLGHPDDPAFRPPLKQLVVGWPRSAVDVEGVPSLLRAIGSGRLKIVIGKAVRDREQIRFTGFELLAAIRDTLLVQSGAVGLIDLELDLTGYGLEVDVWRTNARWITVQATCASRGIELRLTVAAPKARPAVMVAATAAAGIAAA